MSNRFLWKIGGEAGWGVMTTGLLLSKIASRFGYYAFEYVEYPSLIRGGHNTSETLISDEEPFASKKEIDLLVCPNEATYRLHRERLTKNSRVVYDADAFRIEEDNFIKINVPFKKILEQEQSPIVMMNNIALGASLALMGWPLDPLYEIIEQSFAKKGKEVIDKNKKVAQKGFDIIRKNYPQFVKNLFPPRANARHMVLSGNEAFCLGAVAADCRLYASYPMTPSSSVLNTMAAWAEKTGIVVRHAEDEISVINHALGASFAGVRAAVGTSGGGFALMVESLALAGITEIPVVIFLSQRPGPATGMPTWTEQGDLLFAVHAGHGEFPKIVLAPGDEEEMYQLTVKAFDLADIYQTPVIIISDKFLSEAHASVNIAKLNDFLRKVSPDRGKIIRQATGQKYLRYQVTEDGISPMLIPGQKGYFYQANSYEHSEDGHTTESTEERRKQVEKRNRKAQTYLKNHFEPPKLYGDFKNSKIVFVAWGSAKGPVMEAVRILKEKNIASAFLYFNHLYPLDEVKIRKLFEAQKKYVLVENNSRAQFGQLLREQTGVELKEKLLKYDGRPFYPEDIVEYIINNNTL